MKKIELFERAIAEQAASLKDWGINPICTNFNANP